MWRSDPRDPSAHETRRGYVVPSKLPYSRADAEALVFSKEWADIAWGMNRCLGELGALPRKLVWDRECAIHRGDGCPTEAFAGFGGQLALGWIILDPGDCQPGQGRAPLERDHRFLHGPFEGGRSFANELDFQGQLDAWSAKVNGGLLGARDAAGCSCRGREPTPRPPALPPGVGVGASISEHEVRVRSHLAGRGSGLKPCGERVEAFQRPEREVGELRDAGDLDLEGSVGAV